MADAWIITTVKMADHTVTTIGDEIKTLNILSHDQSNLNSELRNDNGNDDEDDDEIPGIKFVNYRDESQLDSVMRLVGKDLSEPYSVFTYRYFLHRFPQLCIFAVPTGSNASNNGDRDSNDGMEPIGCVVCKVDEEAAANDNDVPIFTGYMAMLTVDTSYRRSGIGSALVRRANWQRRRRRSRGFCYDTEALIA